MSSRRVSIVILVAIAAVVVILLVARQREPAAAATLSGTTLDGAAFDLADHRGTPVVINFFASWCGPCNAEAPDLAAFAQAHPEVDFVGVDVQDTSAAGSAFMTKYGLTFPAVADPEWSIGAAWKVDGVPTTIFIDQDGVEKDRVIGASDRATFEEKLKSIQ